jgi:hypothetical protein
MYDYNNQCWHVISNYVSYKKKFKNLNSPIININAKVTL